MSEITRKIHTSVLQISILLFSSALLYFVFVYYPKTISQYRNAMLAEKPIIPTVTAKSDGFPIEETGFRVVYETQSDTYYVFVNGENLSEFAANKNAAEGAIKNALGSTTLCDLWVIYASTASIKVPPDQQGRGGC